jgi:hypothetical protein
MFDKRHTVLDEFCGNISNDMYTANHNLLRFAPSLGQRPLSSHKPCILHFSL